MPADRNHEPTPRRRLRVVLAAGLVLGIGAVTTLAAWNDSEVATSDFASSTFDTESSADGGPFASHVEGNEAVLSFAATGMSPGVSHFAFLDVRTTAASTVGGTVELTETTTSGPLTPFLEYRVAEVGASTTCDAGAFMDQAHVPVGDVAAVSDTLAAGAGSTSRFCVDVRIVADADNSAQGTTATVDWTFTATSTD